MQRRLWIFFVFGLWMILLNGLTITPASAQGNLNWNAQYFNNTSLSGSPAATATLSNLNIGWGNSAPANGIGADNWTARFNTVAQFNTGTYRFTINADDAVRLYVHNTLILDTFSNPQPNKVQTAEFTFPSNAPAGVQIDYREYIGDAFLYVSWQQISTPGNNPPVTGNGVWMARYYNNTNFSGDPNNITSYNNLQLNWGRSSPVANIGTDNWTARFNTTVNLPAGRYRFDINADDAFRLYVNNQQVLETINNPQPNRWMSTDVNIAGGNVNVQVDYREYIGDAFLYVSWQRLGDNQPAPTPIVQPSAPALTVNTDTLNFRRDPFVANNIISRLSRGQRYPVTGRTAGWDWYQIQASGTTGWVSSQYVVPVNVSAVPVVNPPAQQPPVVSGYTLSPTVNLSIRSGPGTRYRRLTVLPRFQVVAIVGRNGSNTWWEINYGNTRGWVSGAYVSLPANLDISRIPVNG